MLYYNFFSPSPRIRLARCKSFGCIVTLLAWMAQRFISSKSWTTYDSVDSCKAARALLWMRKSPRKPCKISFTRRWNGNRRIRKSVVFWYFLISLRAFVPGLNLLLWAKGLLIGDSIICLAIFFIFFFCIFLFFLTLNTCPFRGTLPTILPGFICLDLDMALIEWGEQKQQQTLLQYVCCTEQSTD